MPHKFKINRKIVDVWTLTHFLSGFIIALFLMIILCNLPLVLLFGLSVIVIWELFEYWMKKYYDVFNIPFGHKTVKESQNNSISDIMFGILGIIFYVFCASFC